MLHDLRKYFSGNRVTSVWDNLSRDVVRGGSINSYKNYLRQGLVKKYYKTGQVTYQESEAEVYT